MKRKSKFKYAGRTRDQVEQAARGSSRKGDSMFTKQFEMFKPRDGKNRVRVMPPTFEGYTDFGLEIHVNYNVGADNSAFLSLQRMKGEADPIYEERQRANQRGDDEYAKSLAPRKKLLCWVIDRKDEDKGPLLWSMPATIARNVNTLSVDDSSNSIVVHEHPDDGFDIEFNKEGQGLTTRYSGEAIARHQTPLSDDPELYQSWMEYIEENPLDEILVFYSYDHIARVFGGNVQQDEEESGEQEPARTRTTDHQQNETEDGGDDESGEVNVPWKSDEEEEEDSPPPKRASAGARRFRKRSA